MPLGKLATRLTATDSKWYLLLGVLSLAKAFALRHNRRRFRRELLDAGLFLTVGVLLRQLEGDGTSAGKGTKGSNLSEMLEGSKKSKESKLSELLEMLEGSKGSNLEELSEMLEGSKESKLSELLEGSKQSKDPSRLESIKQRLARS